MTQEEVLVDDVQSSPIVETHMRAISLIFGTWSLLASLLIFWVELLVAKMLLPQFGGSAAVWNTALVFFQVTLLAGYFFAHMLARYGGRHQRIIQIAVVVVPIATLPVALPTALDSTTLAPSIVVVLSLAIMVGAPFFALSTSTPTLQTWFSQSQHKRAADPYFLYSLSNVGSVIGLLGFPLFFERLLTVDQQTRTWAFAYVLFAIITAGAAWAAKPSQSASRVRSERASRRHKIEWAAIAFVPSLALLGVTQHLSTDVAAFPLMWTVPLALYLASFVIAFRENAGRWIVSAERTLRVIIVPTALVAVVRTNQLWLEVALPLILLMALAIAAHGRVYMKRPPVASLTDFYLWVSIGGAAGGLFATFVAPQVFDFVAEYPASVLLAALFAGPAIRKASLPPIVTGGVIAVSVLLIAIFSGIQIQLLWFALAAVVAVLWSKGVWLLIVSLAAFTLVPLVSNTEVLTAERTFFGVYRVYDAGDYRFILSGTTAHGMQIFDDGVGRFVATSYYSPIGPAGEIMESFISPPRDVAIIGLGIGGLVPYGGVDDTLTYYEIDPAVEDIARNDNYFTYLSESEAEVDVVIGDGRLQLARSNDRYDMVIVDAFTSDAVPVHLLTLEAFRVYAESLKPGGKIVVHITNRHLDLEPIVGRVAEELGMAGRTRTYTRDPGDRFSRSTKWVILEDAATLPLNDDWRPIRSGDVLWTDDYSNVLSVINWD